MESTIGELNQEYRNEKTSLYAIEISADYWDMPEFIFGITSDHLEEEILKVLGMSDDIYIRVYNEYVEFYYPLLAGPNDWQISANVGYERAEVLIFYGSND